jgi:hypothetical protein
MAANNSITPRRLSTAVDETALMPEADFFGPPPLIDGEDPAAYQALNRRVSVAVRPRDFIEETWVWEVVALFWEAQRWRRLKAAFLRTVEYKGVEKTIEPLLEFLTAEPLSKRWARREPEALKEVSDLLTKSDLTIDAVMGQALVLNLDAVERIDRLLASAEARRNNALREIERHRASFGAHLRAAVQEAEDTEYTDVETGQASVAPEQ